MTQALEQIAVLLGMQIEIWFLVFLRVGGIFALLPAFGEQMVPARIRLVLSLFFTMLLVPVVADKIPIPSTQSEFLRVGLIEALSGLALGMFLRLLIMVLQMAGSIAANATSLAQVFGGNATEPQPAIAHILYMAGLATIALMDLHLNVLIGMIDSYDMFLPGVAPSAGELANWMVDNVARAFSIAFALAAPFVVVSLIYNLALGAINRAMPQLMVAFVGAPAITAAGLILLLLCGPMIVALWAVEFGRAVETLGVR